jgi:hypothetical protein
VNGAPRVLRWLTAAAILTGGAAATVAIYESSAATEVDVGCVSCASAELTAVRARRQALEGQHAALRERYDALVRDATADQERLLGALAHARAVHSPRPPSTAPHSAARN